MTKALAQTPLVFLWARTLGGGGIDAATSAQQTSDGGFIVAGSTESFGAGAGDIWVLKLDSFGKVEWQKTYGGLGGDGAASVRETSDGGLVVAGITTSFGLNGAWLLKLDGTGNVEWQKAYARGSAGFSLDLTSDGGFIFTDAGRYSVARTDANGNVLWQKSYWHTGYPTAWSVKQVAGGGFMIAGQTTSLGSGNIDALITKLDADGNVIWQKSYGGLGIDVAFSVVQALDGNFILAGQSNSFSGGFTDVWVLKVDSIGNVIWQKTFGGRTPGAFSVAEFVDSTNEGGAVIAGYTSGFGAVLNDAWVVKLDVVGNIVWQHTYGSSGYDLANSVEQTSDGGFLAAGYMQVGPVASRNTDALVLRLDPEGRIPHCDLMGPSDATVTVTNATVTTISQTASNTTASATNTFATVTTTTAMSRIQCFQS